jgi:hypothetical protein
MRLQLEPILILKDENDASPFVLEHFKFCMVQGTGFKCMAYRDYDGTLRRVSDHKALTGSIRILE